LAEMREDGYNASGIKADISIESDIKKLFDYTIEKLGKIDIWINNAGISGRYIPLGEQSSEEITNVIDVNLKGTLLSNRILLPYFIKEGSGIIINMSGRGGSGEASPYMTPYAATKAAVTSLTKSLGAEYKEYPISIFSVMPGMVDTDLIKSTKTNEKLAKDMEALPYILNAFGVPIGVVAKKIAVIASQKPGKVTGKNYSFLSGWRLFRGIILITLYKIIGKV
ncbi:MAG: SDR family oxidoreductase, partial [Actinomycetia bacterium]|nr:SDR family oxidoreductase [Actinomycetes bacterium]